MLITNFKRLECEQICNSCGILIKEKEPAFVIIQEQQHISSVDIILCENCGKHLQNDMSDEFCRFEDINNTSA